MIVIPIVLRSVLKRGLPDGGEVSDRQGRCRRTAKAARGPDNWVETLNYPGFAAMTGAEKSLWSEFWKTWELRVGVTNGKEGLKYRLASQQVELVLHLWAKSTRLRWKQLYRANRTGLSEKHSFFPVFWREYAENTGTTHCRHEPPTLIFTP